MTFTFCLAYMLASLTLGRQWVKEMVDSDYSVSIRLTSDKNTGYVNDNNQPHRFTGPLNMTSGDVTSQGCHDNRPPARRPAHHHVFYLKTHKTGSTTIYSVLAEFCR